MTEKQIFEDPAGGPAKMGQFLFFLPVSWSFLVKFDQVAVCRFRGQTWDNPTEKTLRFQGTFSKFVPENALKLGKECQKDK